MPDRTTAVVQRCLDALAGDTPADPLIRVLLDRAVGRLEMLCANMLYRSYPRLTPASTAQRRTARTTHTGAITCTITISTPAPGP
jgi:hypothetical protein